MSDQGGIATLELIGRLLPTRPSTFAIEPCRQTKRHIAELMGRVVGHFRNRMESHLAGMSDRVSRLEGK